MANLLILDEFLIFTGNVSTESLFFPLDDVSYS